jgi:hypothetical protein
MIKMDKDKEIAAVQTTIENCTRTISAFNFM